MSLPQTPESFQARISYILKNYGSWCAALEGAHRMPKDAIGPDEAKHSILELLKESLPKRDENFAEFDIHDSWHIRTELLRRWGLS